MPAACCFSFRRRRKTLKDLLSVKDKGSEIKPVLEQDDSEKKQLLAHNGGKLKLGDMLVDVSSPKSDTNNGDERDHGFQARGHGGGGFVMRRRRTGAAWRFTSGSLRRRLLLRRAWQPRLVAIPE